MEMDELAIAVSISEDKKTIFLTFSESLEWLELDHEGALKLAGLLAKKAEEVEQASVKH